MTHQAKQNWIEAIMADTELTPAAKVFAYGIFKHMYGKKDHAYPGTAALEKSTGLSRSKFPAYRKALVDADYLTAEVVKGRVYHYTLSDMYPEGTSTCTQKVHDMSPEGTTHVPTGFTKTTSNTSRKTTKSKTTKSAVAPEDVFNTILTQSPSFEDVVAPLLLPPALSLLRDTPAPLEDKQHRWVREAALAEELHNTALRDAGIDPEATW